MANGRGDERADEQDQTDAQRAAGADPEAPNEGGILGVGVPADATGDQLALGIFGAIPTVLLLLLLIFGYRTLEKM